MKTVGIDLSANPAKTSVCAIDWRPFTISFSTRPVLDEEIVSAIASSDFAAIDVPLGWPDAFVEAVTAHSDHAPWPVADIEPPADRETLRFRMTDLITRSAGAQPLSVTTDRIGVAAMRWARLEHLLVTAGVAVDRSGTSGQVCETYPAAVLRHWGFKATGYKTKKNDGHRRRLVDELADRCGDHRRTIHEALANGDDDDLDAFVCAVVARARGEFRTTTPGPDQLLTARREGWIHTPLDDVVTLLHP